MTASTAPQARARWRMTSMSSPPWPQSMATAMTSAPVSSAIQPIATEVSSPPEYASTTRSVMDVSPSATERMRRHPGRWSCDRPRLDAPVGEPQQRGCEFFPALGVAGDDQDGVVSRDGAQDGGDVAVVD